VLAFPAPALALALSPSLAPRKFPVSGVPGMFLEGKQGDLSHADVGRRNVYPLRRDTCERLLLAWREGGERSSRTRPA